MFCIFTVISAAHRMGVWLHCWKCQQGRVFFVAAAGGGATSLALHATAAWWYLHAAWQARSVIGTARAVPCWQRWMLVGAANPHPTNCTYATKSLAHRSGLFST